jgi:hypothetical protein
MKTSNSKNQEILPKNIIHKMSWDEFFDYLMRRSEKPCITFEVKTYSKTQKILPKSIVHKMKWKEFFDYLMRRSEKPCITFEVKTFSKNKKSLHISTSDPTLIQMHVYHLILKNITFLNSYSKNIGLINKKLKEIARSNVNTISKILKSLNNEDMSEFTICFMKKRTNTLYIRLTGYDRFVYKYSPVYRRLYIHQVMFHFEDKPLILKKTDSQDEKVIKNCQSIIRNMYEDIESKVRKNEIKIPNYFDDILK